jgi:hypothetical protein
MVQQKFVSIFVTLIIIQVCTSSPISEYANLDSEDGMHMNKEYLRRMLGAEILRIRDILQQLNQVII